jgi:hypothetical protein
MMLKSGTEAGSRGLLLSGDPEQPAKNIPAPPGPDNREIGDKEKSGYGHTGNREEVPLPEGAPKPHQIF